MLGIIQKMHTDGFSPVQYKLPLGKDLFPISEQIGRSLSLKFSGNIYCLNCGTKIQKSYSQGYCYQCFNSLPQCDSCIVKPELCHYTEGTCRDSKWGEQFCMKDHTVYLANSSGVKVGITRKNQQETRWRDQGAFQALPIATALTRLDSGILEVAFKQHVADKTNWRKMLSGEPESVDLYAVRDILYDSWPKQVGAVKVRNEKMRTFHFPVLEYPQKVVSLNPEKTPLIEGTLQGIKGQYLIFEHGVINIRKYGGYEAEVQ